MLFITRKRTIAIIIKIIGTVFITEINSPNIFCVDEALTLLHGRSKWPYELLMEKATSQEMGQLQELRVPFGRQSARN
jgi:hypothetical protein